MAERVRDVLSIGMEAVNRAMSVPDTEPQQRSRELYRRTVALFGASRTTTSLSGRRGGRVVTSVKCNLFLLAKSSDFLPPTSELERLTRNGLGVPHHEQPGLMETSTKKTIISLTKTMRDLEDMVIAAYPGVPLGRVGFHYGRVNEGKRIEVIHPASMDDLRLKVKKGKLWIIPKREIVLPLIDESIPASASVALDVTPEPPDSNTTLSGEHGVSIPASANVAMDNVAPEPDINTTLSGEHGVSIPASASVAVDNVVPERADINTTLSGEHGVSIRMLDDTTQSGEHTGAVPRNRLALGRTTRRAARRCRENILSYAATWQRPQRTTENVPYTVSNDSEGNGHEPLEIFDSEDEELQRALQESAATYSSRTMDDEDVRLPEALKTFQSKLNSEDKQEIIVSRKSVLDSTFRALKRAFDPRCRIYVKFSGEMGLDHGGPRREFFRLVIQALANSAVFEGQDGSKIFSHNIKKLGEWEYHMSGKLVAMSLLHDGPGLFCLNPHLYRAMTGMTVDWSNFDLNLIPDTDYREILEQLKGADSDRKRDTFLSAHGDWVISQGYTDVWRMKCPDRQRVVASLVKHLVYYRCSAEIQQFVDGLDAVCYLWRTVKENPMTWMELFCFKPEPMKKEQFMELLTTAWSPVGSNSRGLEEDTIYSWEIFLQEIQDKTVDVKFEDVLVFITGADVIPPNGFQEITLDFYSNEIGSERMPYSSTCNFILYLPRGKSNPDEFSRLMVRSLKESKGFGKM